jgi:PKD repeat protein
VYAAAGTYTITLTVTDNGGLTNVATKSVTVAAANVPPVASFTATPTNLSVTVNGSGSTDSDGTVVSYAWNYGDGGTDTGVTPAAHVYAAAGTYTITLTVTDNGGLTNVATKSVTVAKANVPPVASFTATASGLTVALNGSASTDSDGTVVSYAWNYGDGATGTGATSSHTFASAGSYVITLTVTDNGGLTNSITKNVTVAISVLAGDSFTRTVSNGWGSADTGGAWSIVTGAASQTAVDGSVGRMNLPTAGYQLAALLNSYSGQDENIVVDTSANAAATGNGIYQSILARHVGSSDYRLKVRLLPGNVVHLAMSKVVNGSETYFSEVSISGLNYQVGNTLRLRFVLKTSNGVTTLTGTVWNPATAEPTKPQISTTDSTAALQAPGALGLVSYVPAGATTLPVLTTWDNLSVVAP